jgi:Ca-activated chloride channel family protein
MYNMSDFHFIRPWWLLAIIALIFALKLLKKYRLSQSGWQQLLPKHLAKVLVGEQQSQQKLSLTLPFVIGLLAIVALAGPTWKKLPQPVYQLARGSVLIMDMSYSMYATDISPNRLTRSRFKAIDLLEQLNEGEIGLIAYAGDAFTISPLTDDINNIKLLLPSLTPELMPELGSNPLAALTLADEMLTNAGHNKGDIYWFTDGIDNIDIQDITDWSRSNNHRLNILGVGTKAGAPIKLSNGELMKSVSGAIIVPKLSISALQGSAKRGNGYYATLSNNNNDIEQLLRKPLNIEEQQKKESANTGDQWQEVGPYLLLLVLPLLLPYFRRGRLLAIFPLFFLLAPVDKSYAQNATVPKLDQIATQTSAEVSSSSFWQNLWQTKNQQGQQQFNHEAYQQAATNFEDSSWQGSAHYRAGNYQQALESFQQQDNAEALYNQGNALAKLERYDEAIEAYKKALKKDPEHSDAKANKNYLEEMKKQQEKQQQQNKDQSKKQNDDEKQDQKSQNQDKDKEQQKSDDSSQQSSEEQDSTKKDEAEKQESAQNKAKEEKEQQKKEQEKQAQEQKSEESSEDKNKPQQTAAQRRAAEKLAEETKQKHQQLLNKVTDDPYLLLRNKMQLEYQKRRHNRSSAKGTKQW